MLPPPRCHSTSSPPATQTSGTWEKSSSPTSALRASSLYRRFPVGATFNCEGGWVNARPHMEIKLGHTASPERFTHHLVKTRWKTYQASMTHFLNPLLLLGYRSHIWYFPAYSCVWCVGDILDMRDRFRVLFKTRVSSRMWTEVVEDFIRLKLSNNHLDVCFLKTHVYIQTALSVKPWTCRSLSE